MNRFQSHACRAAAIVGLAFASIAPGAGTASGDCPPDFHFGAAQRIEVGQTPIFFAVADYNEDGRTDFAMTLADEYGAGANASVVVLLATGARTYATPVHYALPSAIGIATADFDEDGILDLAVSSHQSDSITIFHGDGTDGQGTGTFTKAGTYAAGADPFVIVAADFNEDGITDLATSLNGEYGVAVLIGQGSDGVGDGTFGEPAVLPLNKFSLSVAVADLNEDGHLDLIATENRAPSIATFLGDGTGHFGTATHIYAGAEPFGLEVADFNEDGHADLAVANTTSGGTAIFLGNGTGSLGSPTFLATGNNGDAAAGDLNGDGILDLVITRATGYNNGDVRIWLGTGSGGVGDGGFTDYATIGPSIDTYQAAIGDFDADGVADAIVSNYRTDDLSMFYGSCATLPPAPTPAPHLNYVKDVANDQGGKVVMTWTASAYDVPGGSVTSYRVWRRVLEPSPAAAGAGLSNASGPEIRQIDSEFWEALATLPAQRLPGYGYTADTPQDSIAGSNPYSVFFITAATNNIDVFYSSNKDSGYSVDNIPPEAPAALNGTRQEMGYVLTWQEPPLTPDLEVYNIYRGASEGFVPSPANRIASLNGLEFMDLHRIGAEYYKLSGVDKHGNEGVFAVLAPTAVAGVGDGRLDFALRGVRPNPSSSGNLTVELSLAAGGPGRLEILDLAGRRMAERDLGNAPGARTVTFRERERLPVGVYLVRLTQNGERRELKAVVVQ